MLETKLQIIKKAQKAMDDGKISSNDLYKIVLRVNEVEKERMQKYADANSKSFNQKRNF